jgi:hypothetical protein
MPEELLRPSRRPRRLPARRSVALPAFLAGRRLDMHAWAVAPAVRPRSPVTGGDRSPGQGIRQRQLCQSAPTCSTCGSASRRLIWNGRDGDDNRTDRMQEGWARFAAQMCGSQGDAGMSLPFRERRALRGIEAGICSSDPGLASWMAFFSRLTADEHMPRHERGPLAIIRICVVMWAAAAAAACAIARAAGACLRAVTTANQRTRPYGSLDGRDASSVAGVPWYWHRYR